MTSIIAYVGIAAFSLAACAHGNAPAASPSSDERVNIDLKDVSLDDAFGTIALDARVNLFVDPDIAGKVTLSARSTPWRDVLAKLAAEQALRVESLSVPAIPRPCVWITKLSSPAAPVTEFTGAPITDRFIDIPIRDAAAKLSAVAKIPIAVDDDVQATVQLMMKDTPWDLALYHMAQKHELRVVRTPTALRLARR